ncbi:hypothetical protein [Lysinibacillus sp. NPDC056185]
MIKTKNNDIEQYKKKEELAQPLMKTEYGKYLLEVPYALDHSLTTIH